MSKLTFTQIEENNEWEGECWNYFLNNNDPLTPLIVQLVKKSDEFEISVVSENVTSSTVKTLLKKKSKTSYKNEYNLVQKIKASKAELLKMIKKSDGSSLYKGQIFEYE